MIFIDFEKAFDSIEWCFLYKCLEGFNFGPKTNMGRLQISGKDEKQFLLNFWTSILENFEDRGSSRVLRRLRPFENLSRPFKNLSSKFRDFRVGKTKDFSRN